MEAALATWMSRNEKKLAELSIKISQIDSESLEFEIEGEVIQMLLPSDPDSQFMVFSHSTAKSANKILLHLNDNLEVLSTRRPDCHTKALDCIISAAESISYVHDETSENDDSDCDEYSDDDDGLEIMCRDGYVKTLADEINKECRAALFRNAAMDDNLLAWCKLSIFDSRRVMRIDMDLRGLFYDAQNTAMGLGIPLHEDSCLSIEIFFTDYDWATKQILVFDSFANADKKVFINSRAHEDERIFPGRECKHGPELLVKGFIREFFKESSSLDARKENVLLQMISSVGKSLRNLKNRCAICKDKLPKNSRLWFCEKSFCMYEFEEMGVGASVLRELQNNAVVELEITVAEKATESHRDVFEPYPSFLVIREEKRERSGFFSSRQKKSEHMKNKQLKLIGAIIRSFPSVEEMKASSSDIDLLRKLDECWRESNEYDNFGRHDPDRRLPYNLLKFILYSNRLILLPVPQEDKVPLRIMSEQFAVIYDDEQEELLKEKRLKQGSRFGFHGSPACNWYSIIRNGLKSLSKTSYMSSGNAHGDGVYFSHDISLARSYADSVYLRGSVKNLVALCEIFSTKIKSRNGNNQIFVVPGDEEKEIVIRYLLLLDESSGSSWGADCGGVDYIKSYTKTRQGYVEGMERRALGNKRKCEGILEKRTAALKN